jgi:G3E family GTPase
VILLNKTDLIQPEEIVVLESIIRLRNLHARIYPTAFADIPLEQVLDIRAFDVDNILASDPSFLDVSYPFEWAQLYNLTQGSYQLQFENTHRHATRMLILYANDGSEAAISSTIEGARAIFRQGFFRMELSPQADVSPLLMYDIPEGLLEVKATINLPETGHYLFFLEENPHHFGLWQGEEKQISLRTEQYGPAHQHESVQSVALTFEGTLDGEKVDDWLTALLQTRGDDIFRTKGILSVAHSGQKIIVQAVHRQLNSRYGADWGQQARQNAIVFIGRNLDKQVLEEGLKACLVPQSASV